MEYITTLEASLKWHISQRRVAILASEGRIANAKLIGNRWMIPFNQTKPNDYRYKTNKEKEIINDEFRFNILLYPNSDRINNILTDDEILLRKVVSLFFACDFKKAYDLLGDLPNRSNNIYVRFIALYIGCLLCVMENNPSLFEDYYFNFTMLLQKDFTYKKEMEFIYAELNATLGDVDGMIENFKIDPCYHYHPDFLPHISIICTLYLFYSNENKNNLSSLPAIELFSSMWEGNPRYVYDSQTIHLYLGLINEQLGKNEEKEHHFKSALDITYQYNLYWYLSLDYYYFGQSIEKVLQKYPKDFIDKVHAISADIDKRFIRFFNGKNSFAASRLIPKKKYIFFYYALQGYTNKEIANLLNISENSVKKNYSLIYESLGVHSKQELILKYKEAK